MRRADKEIESIDEITDLIRKCQVCRIGMSRNDKPYIVPVSFGFDGDCIYFHTVIKNGLKLEYLAANTEVCFEFEHNVEVVVDDTACDWTFEFQSIIGFGQVEELVSGDDKIEGLQQIMKQYSQKEWDFDGISLKGLSVWKIVIESMTGKQSLNFKNEL
jgi:nitroimidazol reductase NimA-like FMN-containing flavoprotein (pyridoxamine 5'-phosphate oxidase superfamily)